MWPSIVMLEDNFVLSLLVLRPFLLQCPPSTHQLRSMLILCDGFTRFQQLIIHHIDLLPLNAEHNLGIVNIWSDRHRESNIKTSSDSIFAVAVYKKRNAVQHLSASTRTELNFLTSKSFP